MKALEKRIAKGELASLIKARQFSDIFTDYLGWDAARGVPEPVEVGGEIFLVNVAAQKRGFAVCVCDMGDKINLSTTDRNKFVRKLSRRHYEHLLICIGGEQQRWSVAIRPKNRSRSLAEVEWSEDQDIQGLLEKLDGLLFSIEEEKSIGISDVVERVHGTFAENIERITKSFYTNFKEELDIFAEFLEGIEGTVSRKWYASLMINRLMFLYFLQRKGFLNGEKKYLELSLERTREKFGKDKFHSLFYRRFLRRLFHEGLDSLPEERSEEINQLLGDVPYLNGGLFDAHSLEKESDINIPDRAFERLFNFFGKYRWHLDDRHVASGKDINPDVIGNIFEKYINDRAAMGAYYTQEDITGYIARNTIIPFLLRQVQEQCPEAFEQQESIWRLLRENPDKYIYDAARHGCQHGDGELPENVRCGLDVNATNLLGRREFWNKPANKKFGLETEIWRETITRRGRYFELIKKIKAGEICSIDDLTSYNLDVQRFVEDALDECESAEFVACFFGTIAGREGFGGKSSNLKDRRGISILDPSCGSGAFLFAALRVLEPLYERCVARMEEFVAEDDKRIKESGSAREGHPFFRAVLKRMRKHPNRRYWIYKSIILNNLFGVDIMPEAVEIAKLRLFLKLAAEAKYEENKPNLGLEPLPDIDYNIRVGNSLVGFASMTDLEDKAGRTLDLSSGLLDKVRKDADKVADADLQFRLSQEKTRDDYLAAKKQLSSQLEGLNVKLDELLAQDYGLNKDSESNDEINTWKKSHQPFHWLAEFYDIVENHGGFDVIIGNPPYVKYSNNKKEYALQDYKTEKCRNLYAFFVERSVLLGKEAMGLILPISFPSTPGMDSLRDLLKEQPLKLHISNFAIRPASLFKGVLQRLSILLASPNAIKPVFTTNFLHWYSNERANLFSQLAYQKNTMLDEFSSWPKIGANLEIKILEKVFAQKTPIESYLMKNTEQFPFHLKNRLGYWVLCFLSPKKSREFRTIYARTEEERNALMAIFNSTLFFWFWELVSDCWHLTKRERTDFKINFEKLSPLNLASLAKFGAQLESDLEQKKKCVNAWQTDYEYYHNKSKLIMDEIDKILADHYGFTDEELDYIINYGIEYRTGLKK